MSSEIKYLRKKYCIFGCDKLDVHIHHFPHPVNHHEWYANWIAAFDDKLKHEDPMKLFKNKRICDYHFKPEEITAGRRLKYGAVPTLNLNGVFKPKYCTQSEHNYASPILDDHPLAQQSSVLKRITST